MKRFCLGALALILSTGAWSLDTDKMALIEKEGGELMQTNDAPALQRLEATLGSTGTGADAKTQFRAGVVAHNLARALPGKGWALKAVDRFQGPLKGTDPELVVVALAYLGSAKALAANDDANPAMKITLVNQGWDLLSEAVTKGGESSFLPRFLRASVGQSLPEFFGKAPTVVADTRALNSWGNSHPGRLDQGMQAQIALMEANALKKTKNLDGAIDAWKRTLALDPQKAGPGKAAAAALELYDE